MYYIRTYVRTGISKITLNYVYNTYLVHTCRYIRMHQDAYTVLHFMHFNYLRNAHTYVHMYVHTGISKIILTTYVYIKYVHRAYM